jgi:hypothetical protein
LEINLTAQERQALDDISQWDTQSHYL